MESSILNPSIELVNISGPCGSGKDTLIDELVRKYGVEKMHRVQTITTKNVRPDDHSYRQVSKDELLTRISTGSWLVNWQENNKIGFGTSIDEIQSKSSEGKLCIHSVYAHDTGAGVLRKIFGTKLLSIAVLPSDREFEEIHDILFKRMSSRNLETTERIRERLMFTRKIVEYIFENPQQESGSELLPTFDAVVINKNEELSASIERCHLLIQKCLGESASK